MQVGILEAMPGPGRHFYSPLEFERELVPDILVKPGQIGVVTAKMGKSRVGGDVPGRPRRATGASGGRSSRPAATGSTSTPSTSRSSTPTPASAPAPGPRAARRRPDPDPARLRRRRHQQDRQPDDRRDPGDPGQRPPAGDLLPQPRGEAGRHHQRRLQRDDPDGQVPSGDGSAPEMASRLGKAAGKDPELRSPGPGSSSPPTTASRSTSTTRPSGGSCPTRRPTWSASSARSRTSSRR